MAVAEYKKDWIRQARYGKSNSRYAKVCAIGHASTGGKCTCCGKPSDELHHAMYWAWWQWVMDAVNLLRGKRVELPVWEPRGRGKTRRKMGGLVQGREVIGWSAFPLCRNCHDLVHRQQHWLSFTDEVKHCWAARNKWTTLWRLRLLWQLRRVRQTG